MLAVSSFKDELARCGEAAADRLCAGRLRATEREAVQKHICRWASNEEDAQEVWEKIKKNAPELEAREFIDAVLEARVNAIRMREHLANFAAMKRAWAKVAA